MRSASSRSSGGAMFRTTTTSPASQTTSDRRTMSCASRYYEPEDEIRTHQLKPGRRQSAAGDTIAYARKGRREENGDDWQFCGKAFQKPVIKSLVTGKSLREDRVFSMKRLLKLVGRLRTCEPFILNTSSHSSHPFVDWSDSFFPDTGLNFSHSNQQNCRALGVIVRLVC